MGALSSGHDGFGGGLGAPAGRLEIAAVWNDVGMHQWRSASQILVFHLMSGGSELTDDAGNMDAVPDQHGIGEKAEATGFVHHLFVVAGAEVTPIGEEQRLGEDVAEFAAVELQLDGVTQRFFLDVAKNVKRLH